MAVGQKGQVNHLLGTISIGKKIFPKRGGGVGGWRGGSEPSLDLPLPTTTTPMRSRSDYVHLLLRVVID